jgi:hypothetical protein
MCLSAIASGLFWVPMTHWLNLIGPMMLNDGPAVNRVLVATAAAFFVYVFLSVLFFRRVLRNRVN